MGKRLMYSVLLLGALLLAFGVGQVFLGKEPLMQEGSSAGLGLMLLEKEPGLYVLAVTKDSQADRAEILPGDHLIRAGTEELRTLEQLEGLIDGADFLQLVLLREERELTVQLSPR